MMSANDRMRLMNRSVRRHKDTLLESGSIFPALALYRTGEPFEIHKETECDEGIILIRNTDPSTELADDFTCDSGEQVHVSLVVFKYGGNI